MIRTELAPYSQKDPLLVEIRRGAIDGTANARSMLLCLRAEISANIHETIITYNASRVRAALACAQFTIWTRPDAGGCSADLVHNRRGAAPRWSHDDLLASMVA